HLAQNAAECVDSAKLQRFHGTGALAHNIGSFLQAQGFDKAQNQNLLLLRDQHPQRSPGAIRVYRSNELDFQIGFCRVRDPIFERRTWKLPDLSEMFVNLIARYPKQPAAQAMARAIAAA